VRFLTSKSLFLRKSDKYGSKLLLITNRKSHKFFEMPRKSLTLHDLERSLRTLLCQSCRIVAKRYVVEVGDGTIG